MLREEAAMKQKQRATVVSQKEIAPMIYDMWIRTDLASCNQTISHNDYNQMAMAYNNDVLGKFPANVLKRVALVPELELFN